MSENYVNLMHNWNWTDCDDFCRKYAPDTNPQAYAKFNTIPIFF